MIVQASHLNLRLQFEACMGTLTHFSSSGWIAHADVAPRKQQSSVTLVILKRLPAIVVVERVPAIVNAERLPAVVNVERLPAVDPSRLCSRKVASTILNTK